jgi:hypothetical protein
MARLGFVVIQIGKIEEARQKRLEQQPEAAPHAPTATLSATASATAPVPQRRWLCTKRPGRVFIGNIPDEKCPDAPSLRGPGSRISTKATFVKVDCAACHHVALLTP